MIEPASNRPPPAVALPRVVRVLGIDPGLNRTGYAIIEKVTKGAVLREGGVIRSTKELALAERVHELACGLREVIAEMKPSVMAIEQVFSHVAHPKTAILMAHARGVILLAAAEAKLPVIHYTPTQIKKLLTGNGHATKLQMQYAIQHELHLKQLLEPNDVADAAAVAICHYHSVKHVIADVQTQSQVPNE
ncbi:MAG: crossover junction endodeoxyribonuclease RuvC [Planctomycetota bacterium]|nr:crossover junction endodeoxyribonuclease RuvC [Planctomycetota bacterium]MDA1162969.1 crossover junction endodeoxyribonuclease RuvC [Planctomycetota bacterium]